MRRSYIQIEGVLYERGTEECARALGHQASRGGPSHFIIGDAPDFVSPIDGTVVHGRAGIRDHCARHGVVPTEELKGVKKPGLDFSGLKETIIRATREGGHWYK